MATPFYPLSACELQASENQTILALSVVHLFQSSFAPEPSNVLADYTAAEADFSGYAAETLTAWFDPILAPGSGYMIQSPWTQFAFDSTPGTPTNNIGGCYLLSAGGAIRLTVIFDQPIPMEVHGQGIGFNLTLFYPTGV